MLAKDRVSKKELTGESLCSLGKKAIAIFNLSLPALTSAPLNPTIGHHRSFDLVELFGEQHLISVSGSRV